MRHESIRCWFVRWLPLLILTVTAGACASPSNRSDEQSARPKYRDAVNREPLSPLARPPRIDSTLVALGRTLLADKRLSSYDTIPSPSCHSPPNGRDDAE